MRNETLRNVLVKRHDKLADRIKRIADRTADAANKLSDRAEQEAAPLLAEQKQIKEHLALLDQQEAKTAGDDKPPFLQGKGAA